MVRSKQIGTIIFVISVKFYPQITTFQIFRKNFNLDQYSTVILQYLQPQKFVKNEVFPKNLKSGDLGVKFDADLENDGPNLF